MSNLLSALTRVALACCAFTATTLAKADYVLNEFLVPGSSTSTVWDINDAGAMVGDYRLAAGGGSAFIYNAGAYTLLSGPTGSTGASAIGLSNNGVVTGNWFNGSSRNPYVYANGQYLLTSLTIPNGSAAEARGISPDGSLLTGYYNKNGGGQAGFVYSLTSNSVVATIDAGAYSMIAQGINSRGQRANPHHGLPGHTSL